MGRCTSIPTIRTFLNGNLSAGGFSATALRVKASALLSQADVVISEYLKWAAPLPRSLTDIS